MKNKFIILVTFFIALFVLKGMIMNHDNEDKVLYCGLGTDGWGPLFPAQQSSLYGSIIMSHVYDSLIGVDNTGGFIPNLASTWNINKDRTIYTFIIDTTKQFSDGTYLTAQIYKDSLLHSLKLEAAGANKSALDVLYALRGFEDFQTDGDIEGLKVVDEKTLVMYFKRPYRRAIDQLSGTRYGAYQLRNGGYLGTGPYLYDAVSSDRVELSVNPFHNPKPAIGKIVITPDGNDALLEGKIEMALPQELESINNVRDSDAFEKLSFLLSKHKVVVLNGRNNSTLKNKRHRKAIQYILFNEFKKYYQEVVISSRFDLDSQFYPLLFPGHIDNNEANELIKEGSLYVDQLQRETNKKPLLCISRKGEAGFDYCSALVENNVKVLKREATFEEVRRILTKTFDVDLVGVSVTYASADPDGVYHFLGKNGAIWSPMSSREKVEMLLEEGRAIIDESKVDKHYKKVSSAILDEVPVVHFGSQYLYLKYNPQRIRPSEMVSAKRKAINATLFEWR